MNLQRNVSRSTNQYALELYSNSCGIFIRCKYFRSHLSECIQDNYFSLVAELVNNLPAMWETWL